MKEDISRSSIFRSKMKIDAVKRNEEDKLTQDVQRNERNKRSDFFQCARRTSLPNSKEDIEK